MAPNLTKEAPPGRIGTFYALHFRDFRLLWGGSFFSSAGQWIQQTTVGWVVYDLTGSGSLLGLVNGMRSLPMLLFGPLGGVAADRLNRKALMVTSQLFLTLVCFALAVDIALNQLKIWHLFVFTFLTGIAWASNQPVRQSVIFDLVPRHAFPNAVALNSSAFNFTRILGPTLAGFLIGWLGPQGNFFVESAAYLGVSITTMMLVVPVVRSSARQQSMGKNFLEGMQYVVKEPRVRILMVLGLFPVLFGMPYMALLPIFAKDVFHAGSQSFGFLLSAVGFGGLLGALFTASLGKFDRRGLLQLGAMVIFGLGLVLLAFMSSAKTGALVLLLTGFGQMTFMTTNQTLLQMNIPDELRGRITSIYMLDQGLVPLGTLMSGFGADHLGAPAVVAIMGTLCIGLAIMIFFWVPQVRNMRMSGPMPVRMRMGGVD